jgi:hypothetical protein
MIVLLKLYGGGRRETALGGDNPAALLNAHGERIADRQVLVVGFDPDAERPGARNKFRVGGDQMSHGP